MATQINLSHLPLVSEVDYLFQVSRSHQLYLKIAGKGGRFEGFDGWTIEPIDYSSLSPESRKRAELINSYGIEFVRYFRGEEPEVEKKPVSIPRVNLPWKIIASVTQAVLTAVVCGFAMLVGLFVLALDPAEFGQLSDGTIVELHRWYES